jgi:hypothetical protein
MLDQNNYRLGPLDSQMDCIEIMFEEFGEKMTRIAGHIARNGLSPKPVVVSKDDKDRWVVKDGNRRVTALKLLNNPAQAPDKYKRAFQELKKTAVPGMVPSQIECLTADDATLMEYRKLEHMGAQDGIGQVDWNPRAKDNMLSDVSGKLKYPLAGAVCEYLSKRGVQEARTVFISNIQRLLQDPDIGKKIGISWNGKNISFTAKEDEVFEVLKEIVVDFVKNKKKVGEIYYPGNREKYITDLFKTRGIKEPTPLKTSSNPSQRETQTGRYRTITQPSWDRKRTIPRNMGLPIPGSESKTTNILVELSSRIDVREAPIGAGVLVRLLLERSVEYYGQKEKITFKDTALHKRIRQVAEYMKSKDLINKKEKEQLEKMSNNDELISAHTLNAWVHNPNYTPTPRDICTFWDNIYFFLLRCWR